MATLISAAVLLPSKDSACCPALRRFGDKIYHTPCTTTVACASVYLAKFQGSSRSARIRICRFGAWEKPGIICSCSAGQTKWPVVRPGQRGMHVRRATRRGRRRGAARRRRRHARRHARSGRVLSSLAGRAGRRRPVPAVQVLCLCARLVDGPRAHACMDLTGNGVVCLLWRSRRRMVSCDRSEHLVLVWTGLQWLSWSGIVRRSSDEWLATSCGSETDTIVRRWLE
jgi:hypothetical protein